jgi:peroxiredoxin Q/BCP
MNIRTTLSTIASLIGLAFFAHGAPLEIGAAAPEVSGTDQDGRTVNFKDVYAKGITLVYFYPKADTPGCTKQGCSIRDSWKDLQVKQINVIGVSEDTVEAQKKFAEKYTLPHTLIADADGKVAAAFGVDMMGKMTARQSFLIKDGKVVWNMLKGTTTATHAADVMKAVDELAKK